MTTMIDASALFTGPPVSLTVGGVEAGATTEPPKFSIAAEYFSGKFQGAKGPVKGTLIAKQVVASVELKLNEVDAQRFAWALPGATATSTASVGQVRAGLDTTLGADPALGATLIRLTSVTTVNTNDFIRIGAAGVAATEANSEVVKVTTVGTAGATDTVVENSAGGGLLIDHANGAEVKTVTGTILAAPASAGDVNIKVDSVTGLAPNDYVRIGYVGHYETRQLTAVGTTGPSGTGLTFAIPLTRDHALDEWVIEVTALGSTRLVPNTGRVPSNAYQEVILTEVGLDGRQIVVTLENCVSAENQDISFGDDEWAGLAIKLTAYYDPATPTVPPFYVDITA